MTDVHDTLDAMHPPIYAEVVALHGDPFTIDQRYEPVAMTSPHQHNRADLIAFLQARGVRSVDGKPLHQVKTTALRQAIDLANTRFEENR